MSGEYYPVLNLERKRERERGEGEVDPFFLEELRVDSKQINWTKPDSVFRTEGQNTAKPQMRSTVEECGW